MKLYDIPINVKVRAKNELEAEIAIQKIFKTLEYDEEVTGVLGYDYFEFVPTDITSNV